MKKYFSTLLALIAVLCFCPTAHAESPSYTLPSLNMTVEVPNNFYAFTRDFDPNDPNLDSLGMSTQALKAFMKNNNIYLIAVNQAGDEKFLVGMTEDSSGVNNISELSESDINKLINDYVNSSAKDGSTFSSHRIYTNSQEKYIVMDGCNTQNDKKDYFEQYLTIVNSQDISLKLFLPGEMTDEMSQTLKTVVDNTVFLHSPQPSVSNTAARSGNSDNSITADLLSLSDSFFANSPVSFPFIVILVILIVRIVMNKIRRKRSITTDTVVSHPSAQPPASDAHPQSSTFDMPNNDAPPSTSSNNQDRVQNDYHAALSKTQGNNNKSTSN